jgi:hypothetical protein
MIGNTYQRKRKAHGWGRARPWAVRVLESRPCAVRILESREVLFRKRESRRFVFVF